MNVDGLLGEGRHAVRRVIGVDSSGIPEVVDLVHKALLSVPSPDQAVGVLTVSLIELLSRKEGGERVARWNH